MNTYEICQMDMTFRIQQNVIRLHISVNDTLRVDISQRTAKLCNPKSDSFLCKAFSRDMEPQVTTIHQIHDNVAFLRSVRRITGKGSNRDVHVFDILKAVSQVAKEGMVQMLEHASFTNDIPYAFGLDH